MWKLMNFFMLSCRKASELIEKKLLFGLSPLESIHLKVHTSMCTACTAYQKQSKDIHKALGTFVKEKQDLNGTTATVDVDKLKEKIIRSIEKK